MNARTRRALGALNRRFYDATAAEFAASRQSPWAGWDRVFDAIGPPAQGPLRVLDIGCGNARFARFLLGRERSLDYLGLDASEALLAAAGRDCSDLDGVALRHADFVASEPDLALPHTRFDLVVLFGVLHHVPGDAAREALLRAALGRLAPGGLLAATFWQFGDRERFRRKAVPWSEAPCVDPEDLEPGDVLLPWGAGAGPPRYCHFATPQEIDALASRLPARIEATFDADGRTDDLNRYVLWRAEASGIG